MSTDTESGARLESVGTDQVLEIYRRMALIRRSDERIRMGMAGGEFGFAYWPVEGQEAMSAGAAVALQEGDQLVTTYRGCGDSVAMGVPLGPYFAELMGKATGLSKGKAGAMGVSAPELGLAWATGIVGEGPPIANGFALAAKLRGDGSVVLVSFGDGATSIGFVHEAMNMSAVWDLPVVFFCQNNAYAECTPVAEYTRTGHFAERAAGYGMPGVTVDGTDPIAVYGAVSQAVTRAREGRGPTLVEAVAFRLQGHYFGDPMVYVDKDRMAKARSHDPVPAFRKRILAAGVATPSDLDKLDESIHGQVEEAISFAVDSPVPDPASELYTDVYAGSSADSSVTTAPPSAAEPAPSGETQTMGLAQAITYTLDRAMARDDSIVLLGEDISDPAGGIFRMTAGLSTKYGNERVRSTPIAESAIVGCALGLSMAGFRAVPEIMFLDFLGVCLDQLANHAAKVRYMSGGRRSAPLTMRVALGAASGAQHSQSLEAWLMHVPGLKVAFPSDPADAAGLLNSCLTDDDPCVFIEARTLCMNGSTAPVPTADWTVPLGRAAVKRAGSDATVVAYGPAVPLALAAAEQLASDQIDVEVIDLRSLVPLDLPTVLESVARTGRLVISHVSATFCGPGAEIAAAVQHELHSDLEAPIERVAASFTPVPFARTLELASLPSVDRIAGSVRQSLAR
jgi:pyruvate/2-oxoglutarate/acetoin dehydrogenase E1 component/TPP-dependent pyruvate/acetoin dehydrogenase alpha subunit